MNVEHNDSTNTTTTIAKVSNGQKKTIKLHNKNKNKHKNKDKIQHNRKDTTTTSANKDSRHKRKFNKPKKTTPSSVSPSTNNSQRSKAIKQCQTLLSNKQFRLFRDDKQSTQYGFTLNNKINNRYVVVIPNDYSSHPIRLLNQKNDQNVSDSLEYSYLINNFNKKCKLDDPEKTYIVSQLNYLAVNHDILTTQSPKDFNNYMHLHKTFYNQFK
ncbi:hypothetical protein RI543_004658 [Arxiozyma heterogenica]|uniref:Uncharacterized protein n=1 Tax=Arxiozyma heterogenica TaxID=278026 RepID=A0AAN7VZB4_9SACH|nr:hypothetical protein RI543_004658 [Kazachstania heterogenica]